jgi:hypothetical protein
MSGTADASIRFADFLLLLWALGFEERVRGDHHSFTRRDIPEIINVQPQGAMAKVYQVRQVRQIILRYGLGEAIDD